MSGRLGDVHGDSAPHDDAFRDWDAAYLLGALSSADRHAYEVHLRSCAACREGLADFVPLPGLLTRLPSGDALDLLSTTEASHEEAPPALLPRLAAAADALRRRTRVRVAALVLAAAGVSAVAAIALPLAVGSSLTAVETTGSTVDLAAAPGVPVEASVEFVSEAWGTRIDMDCSWGGASGPQRAPGDGGVGYVMYVTDTQGATEAVGSWTSTPGSTMHPTLATGLPLAEIASVEVRLQGSDTVVLTGSP